MAEWKMLKFSFEGPERTGLEIRKHIIEVKLERDG